MRRICHYQPVRALPKGSKRRLRACQCTAAGCFKVSKVTGLAFLHSNVLVRWVESSRRYFGGSRGSLAPPTGCSVRVLDFNLKLGRVACRVVMPNPGLARWLGLLPPWGAATALPGRPSRSRFPGRRRPCPSVPSRVACAWLPLAVGLPSRNRGGVDGGAGRRSPGSPAAARFPMGGPSTGRTGRAGCLAARAWVRE